MPITITPNGATPGTIGWGMFVALQSSVIGPQPTGTHWLLDFFSDADATQRIAGAFVSWTGNPQTIEMTFHASPITVGQSTVVVGQNVFVRAQLTSPSAVVLDQTTASFTWSENARDYIALVQQMQPAGTGLSAAQATQLQQTHDAVVLTPALSDLLNTLQESVKVVVNGAGGAIESTVGALFSGNLLDTLTLTELTDGPTGDPVSAAVTGGYFAIIVRISTVPPNLVLSTPAADYSRPDLAVLRVFRGEDVFLRRGIHETDYVVYPLPFSYGGVPLSPLLVGLPPDLTVDVQWAFGVEGQVFLMKFP